MSRRVVFVAAIAVLVASVGTWWWTQRGPAIETATVSRGSIDVTIQTVGMLQATGATAVRPTAAGSIATLGVALGDVVTAGDIIAILDRGPAQNALASAENALTQAEYALQLAERRSDTNPGDESLRLDTLAAGQRVGEARRAVDSARAALDDSVLLAPGDGTVIELTARVGDAVSPAQPIARLAGQADLRLVADVDELDLPNVAIGAAVTFRLDAFPEHELAGTVRSTAPQARVQGGATVFATTIDFNPEPALDIRPGMNADITIVTASRDNVLLVPERALKTVGERTFVTVREGQRNREREVILGYRSHGEVEIVDGLTEGEIVVLH